MATDRLSTPSPILAMHRQYEAAMEAHHSLDIASSARSYDTAMQAADAETDALRTAILYQVPVTAADAMILQYHVWVAADLYGQKAPEAERAAYLTAIDTLFDFIASETPEADGDQLGRQFAYGAKLARERRRFRAGQLEG